MSADKTLRRDTQRLPSALFLDDKNRRAEVGTNVTDDLNLGLVFDAGALDILRRILTPDEINARHEVFTALADADFRDALAVLTKLSREYADTREMTLTALYGSPEKIPDAVLTGAKTPEGFTDGSAPLASLLLEREAARRYLKLCRAVVSSAALEKPGAKFIDGLIAFFTEKSGETALLEKTLAESETAAAQISRASLLLLPETVDSRKRRSRLQKTPDAADIAIATQDISSDILESAAALGFDLPRRRSQQKRRLWPELSRTLCSLYPESAGKLLEAAAQCAGLVAPSAASLCGELDFYLSFARLCEKAKENKLAVCLPKIAPRPLFTASDAADVSLIVKNAPIVPNDIDFTEDDGVYFLLGANGGGKTTYLRAAASNLLFFLCGCPVFCSRAEIYPFGMIYTHFPVDETSVASGRFAEESRRAEDMIENAGRGDFVFLNETYSGTNEELGTEMTCNAVKRLKASGAFALFVTHFHKARELSQGIPSLRTVVDVSDGNRRTYRIERSPEDSGSYAHDILKKYGLDGEGLRKRADSIAKGSVEEKA